MPSIIAVSPLPRNQDSIIQYRPMYQYNTTTTTTTTTTNNNNNNLTLEIQLVWNVKTKVIPLKIGVSGTIVKSGKHTWRARNQGTTKNSHIGHFTRTSVSTNVKIHNI